MMYNAGYVTSITPEDGTDTSSRTVSNAVLQSVVLTRTMDFWGRAGGLSIVLPYAVANTSSSTFQGSTNGVSDIALLWQINIFGGPALTREQFRSFVPQNFRVSIFTSERRSAPTIRLRRSIRARTVGWSRRPSITAIRRTAAVAASAQCLRAKPISSWITAFGPIGTRPGFARLSLRNTILSRDRLRLDRGSLARAMALAKRASLSRCIKRLDAPRRRWRAACWELHAERVRGF